jgi:two-component system, NarL family, nitrate/nitrite response regulator NarL
MISIAAYIKEPVLAVGFSEVIRSSGRFHLFQTKGTSVEAFLDEACRAEADLVLLGMSHANDWHALEPAKKHAHQIKIILWVNEVSIEMAYQALQLGVRGILRRALSEELLLRCLQKVYEGELWFEKTIAGSVLSGQFVRLSAREVQLVYLIASGLKNKELAEAMGITEGTVKAYLSRLFIKTGTKDRYELALFGFRNFQSWIESADGMPDFHPRSVFIAAHQAQTPVHKHDSVMVDGKVSRLRQLA